MLLWRLHDGDADHASLSHFQDAGVDGGCGQSGVGRVGIGPPDAPLEASRHIKIEGLTDSMSQIRNVTRVWPWLEVRDPQLTNLVADSDRVVRFLCLTIFILQPVQLNDRRFAVLADFLFGLRPNLLRFSVELTNQFRSLGGKILLELINDSGGNLLPHEDAWGSACQDENKKGT